MSACIELSDQNELYFFQRLIIIKTMKAKEKKKKNKNKEERKKDKDEDEEEDAIVEAFPLPLGHLFFGDRRRDLG